MSEARRIDLSELERPAETTRPPGRGARWRAYGLLLLLLAALAALLGREGFELWGEATPVRVVRPVRTGAGVASATEVVLQAAGWVEPDPFPIQVPALTPGVVARFLVEEGDAVEAGAPVAELVPDDARLERERARAELARLRAEHARALVLAENATESYEAALAVTEAAARTKAHLRETEARRNRARDELAESRAGLEVQERELATQRWLRERGAAGPWQVELARARLGELQARVQAREAAVREAEAAVENLRAQRDKAVADLRLRLEDRLLRDRTRADVAVLARRIAEAEVALATAELRWERRVVRAPAAGVVLRREAHPGLAVGPRSGSPLLCLLYDPKKVRIRVDVPLGSVGRTRIGQRAEIRCEARGQKPYHGEVLRRIERADIQKVTLEVQVRVLDPDERLKPEMLCQVSFFGSEERTSAGEKRELLALPSGALIDGTSCWVLDGRTGRAARRAVETRPGEGSRVLVSGGLNPTDKVLISTGPPIREGARIRVVEETR